VPAAPHAAERIDRDLWQPSALGCVGPRGLLGQARVNPLLRYAPVLKYAEAVDRGSIRVLCGHQCLLDDALLVRQASSLSLTPHPGFEADWMAVVRPRFGSKFYDFIVVSAFTDRRAAFLRDWWVSSPRRRSARGWQLLWRALNDELLKQGKHALIANVDGRLTRALDPVAVFPQFETVESAQAHSRTDELMEQT
jgi:hypothetical protein